RQEAGEEKEKGVFMAISVEKITKISSSCHDNLTFARRSPCSLPPCLQLSIKTIVLSATVIFQENGQQY
ncbi:hypothetical protein GNF10_20420, partial [Nostoc sp. UCD121]|uniref:hypothetical protein n=1 Tax=Nostoc sp. UCD121 TaxID=2681305 RepID=UPI0016281C24